MSWAGQYTRFVSTHLFVFLVLHWFWRFIVWTVLLFGISRLSLQLSPMHPDRAAGLGFLSIYPSIFSGYVFALSCGIAPATLNELAHVQHTPDQVWFLVAGWILLNLILFLGTLLVFIAPFDVVRERVLLEYGRLANQHHHEFHRRWIEERKGGEDLMGSPDPSSASNLSASIQMVQVMRVVPVDRTAILQLIVAAGLPMLAVVWVQLPIDTLSKWI